jgi:conjugative transfer signal peptidase TraF
VNLDAVNGTMPSLCRAPRDRDRRRRLASSLLSAGVMLTAALGIVGYAGGLRINFTPSYPLGVWRLVPLDRAAAVGDLVFICPPHTPAFEIAIERGYVRRGLCPGWMSPLIKAVVAGPGQRISVAGEIRVDGIDLPYSQIRNQDAAGRLLTAYAGGVVPLGQLFLHSDFAGSYDSRYFGPIPAAGVLGLARPLLVFDP